MDIATNDNNITLNAMTIENLFNSTLEKIAENSAKIINNSVSIEANEERIKNNTNKIDYNSNLGNSCFLNLDNFFFILGGNVIFPSQKKYSKKLYLLFISMKTVFSASQPS